MRQMPTTISGNPCGGNGGPSTIEVPTIASAEFTRRLTEIAGRSLTDNEYRRADQMAGKGWTLRVVASELFGEAHVDAYFAA